MKQEPKISVIIPVYNVEKYLRECLDSVVNQTLKDIEIICVDDGSIDSSLHILKEYAKEDSRITILSQKNMYAGIARNKGMEYATGKYLYFMDSDDWLEDDALIKIYNKAENEQADIVLFGSYNAVNGKQIKRTWAINRASKPYKNKMELCCRISSTVWDKLYLHSFIKDNHILFEEGRSCNDLFFSCYSLMLAKHISCLEDYLYNYRSSADGAISRTRGDYAFCLPQAMRHIKEQLNELKIWKENKLYFYKKYCTHLHYEFQNCTTYSQKKNLIFAMDMEDFIGCFLQKRCSPNIFQKIFSVKNSKDKRHKVITLLGLKLKFKRKNNMPKVSVIIPVYNVEKYLRECLDSVVNQTLKDIEIICVNDGSTDNSLEILKEYAKKDNRIIIIDQKNQGLSISRNNALKIAKGEYIQFVDSDDYIREDACEVLYKQASKNSLDMLMLNGYNFDNETREKHINSYWEKNYLPNNLNSECFQLKDVKGFVHRFPVTSCLTIYRGEFIKQKHLSFPEHLCFEDNVFFIQALWQAKYIGITDEKLYFRRLHPNQITKNWNKHFADYLKISDIVLTYLKSIKIEDDVYKIYTNTYLNGSLRTFNSFNEDDHKKYAKQLEKLKKKYGKEIHFYNDQKIKIRFLGLKITFKKPKHVFLKKIKYKENKRITRYLGGIVKKVKSPTSKKFYLWGLQLWNKKRHS